MSAERLLSVGARPDGPGRVVVEVVGEVDAFTAPLLEACLQSRSARRDIQELVVDLTQVTFLGAAGIAVLVRANHRCRGHDVRLAVRTAGRRAVLRPLQMSGLEQLLDLDRPVTPDGSRPRRRPRVPTPRHHSDVPEPFEMRR